MIPILPPAFRACFRDAAVYADATTMAATFTHLRYLVILSAFLDSHLLQGGVITSYSIHYTKLYEARPRRLIGPPVREESA